jgi:hypothetical protein
MRITTKIASAGDTFLGRFPVLPCSIDELKDEKGGIDMGKVLAALREYDSTITWSSSDDLGVVALAVEFIRQMESATKKLDQDEEADVRTQCEKAVDRSLERKMDRGRFGYCRIEIDRHGGRLRVRIGISNPKGIVGTVDFSCRRFAVYAARILRYMAVELGPEVGLELVGLGAAEDVFEEAAWLHAKQLADDEIREHNARRGTCVRRLGHYCSPSDPNCPCYCDGKCVEAKLGPEWERCERS